MPLVRKRRAAPVDEEEEEEASQASTPVPPSARQRQSQPSRSQQQRRPPPATQVPDEDGDDDASNYDGEEGGDGDNTTQQQMVKNLVRLALASEYSRIPIRRVDISAKVLGTQSRQFKSVFDAAQLALRDTFGMEMFELPNKESATLAQKRAAQKTAASKSSTLAPSSKAWVLRSILPEGFNVPQILAPPMVPTEEEEAAYIGLYSFVVSLITLSGGTLGWNLLKRHLQRVNADESTPVDRTERLLLRMAKEGYIVKVKETVAGEEVVEYMVGPRAKAEVGDEGVSGMVRRVYGVTGEAGEEELETKIQRSLKITAANRRVFQAGDEQPVLSRPRGRPKKGRDSDVGNDSE